MYTNFGVFRYSILLGGFKCVLFWKEMIELTHTCFQLGVVRPPTSFLLETGIIKLSLILGGSSPNNAFFVLGIHH